MLEKEDMFDIKNEYCELLRKIKREGVEDLIAYLEDTDFFVAPASTQYHCSFPGGLCLHSLNVYHALCSLAEKFLDDSSYKEENLIVIGLLHDIYKIGFYEEYIKNEKVYSAYGKKMDELGAFDWVSSKMYKVKDAEDRNIIGNKGFTSYYRASNFIPLEKNEISALVNQYSAVDRDVSMDLSNILSKNPLAVVLHAADIIATYCIEK